MSAPAISQAEINAFYRTRDSRYTPCLPEPEELINEDWNHAGVME